MSTTLTRTDKVHHKAFSSKLVLKPVKFLYYKFKNLLKPSVEEYIISSNSNDASSLKKLCHRHFLGFMKWDLIIIRVKKYNRI